MAIICQLINNTYTLFGIFSGGPSMRLSFSGPFVNFMRRGFAAFGYQFERRILAGTGLQPWRGRKRCGNT